MKKAIVIKEEELISLIKKEISNLGVDNVKLSSNEEEDILLLDINANCDKIGIAKLLGDTELISKEQMSLELFYVGKYICKKNNVDFTGDYKFNFEDGTEIMFYCK